MEKTEFYGFMCSRGITYSQLADLCNINESSLKRRVKGETEFKLEEIQLIIDEFNLDEKDVMSIFFGT